jgi:hypothetical protein
MARELAAAARAGGFTAPRFRSPPRVPGRLRTIRRHADGTATVSVVLRDRPWSAVVADMIDGFVAVNDNVSPTLRDELWAAAERVDAASTTPSVAPLAAVPPAA